MDKLTVTIERVDAARVRRLAGLADAYDDAQDRFGVESEEAWEAWGELRDEAVTWAGVLGHECGRALDGVPA